MQDADLGAISHKFRSWLNININLITSIASISGTLSTRHAISEEDNIFLGKTHAFKNLKMLDGFTQKTVLLGKSLSTLSTLIQALEQLSESYWFYEYI